MDDSSSVGLTDALAAVGGGIVWVLQNLAQAFYNIGYALTHPSLWLDWSDKEAVMRFVYYGGSVEFFFAVFAVFLVITIIGMVRNNFMWGCVRGLEGFTNTLGRFFAWAGLLMVLQQIIIVIMQRIFTRPDIVIAFGIPLQYDISWYAEMLKFYNALVVSLCVGYTFVQGGHVRVDLFYAPARFGTKKVIDMLGSIFFMMPLAVLVWMYGWYFMWRHLIVPKPSASDTLERLLLKSKAMRWNVETIGFSPNGFTAYFLFKIMLVAFAGLVFLQTIAFLYRSYLEYVEGPDSAGKYLDKDSLGEGEEAYEGAH